MHESLLFLTRSLLLQLLVLTVLKLSSLGFQLFELLLFLSAALVSLPSLPLAFDLLALVSLLLDDLAHVVLQLHSDGWRQLIKLKTECVTLFRVVSSNDLKKHLVLISIKVIDSINHFLFSKHFFISSWEFLINIGWSIFARQMEVK